MRIVFALAGLHSVDRGAEVAFISIARELAKAGNSVTLIGSGRVRPGEPYEFISVRAIPRDHFERLPSIPLLRGETAWEELTFAPGLWRAYKPNDFDLAITCGFPFTHWVLRAKAAAVGADVKQIFVTQNGDWPARNNAAEFRFFRCDGLVCTNPDYFNLNHEKYRAVTIPNGVDIDKFRPGAARRSDFGLPEHQKIVLMVSALIPSKNVADGISAMTKVPGAMLVVAGDGPMREELDALADRMISGRYFRTTVPGERMPDLYRCADAFVHLSRNESFGNVYIEAMSSGLPVVAYDEPRTRWILGDGAYYADPKTVGMLPRMINEALSANDAFSSRSRTRADRFAWPEIAAQYSDFFRGILDGPRS